MPKFDSRAGFTLVELVVVIGLIAILSTVTVALINPPLQIKKSHDAQRKSDMKLIQTAVEEYNSDNGSYPAFGTDAAPQYGVWFAGGLNLNSGGVTYLQTIPVGPRGNDCQWGYVYAGTPNNYTIYTTLENSSDTDATAVKPIPNQGIGGYSPTGDYRTFMWTSSGASCNNVTFNYWVNNP